MMQRGGNSLGLAVLEVPFFTGQEPLNPQHLFPDSTQLAAHASATGLGPLPSQFPRDTEITTATTMYREMGMTYWLGQAETFT